MSAARSTWPSCFQFMFVDFRDRANVLAVALLRLHVAVALEGTNPMLSGGFTWCTCSIWSMRP